MKQITGEELKQIQLNILKEIHSFCVENNLTYFLTGGTLLGAIRHKGFIPWDDDIDVALFRDDYEKFIRTFRSESGHVRIYSRLYDKKCKYIFAKAIDTDTLLVEAGDKSAPLGVFVDVFPIDSVCDDLSLCRKTIKKLQWWGRLRLLRVVRLRKGRNIVKNMCVFFISPVLRLIPRRFFLDACDKRIRKFEKNSHSVYVANLCGAWGEKEITLRSNFSSTIEVEFEGRKYFAPIGYDAFLHDLYGDYMKLPPIEKQKSHHDFVAYFLD